MHLDPDTESMPRPARGRRARGMQSGRHSLLRAASQSFAAYGFKGADLRSIAALAGVAPNLVRVHFGNKAALWRACVDAIAASSAPVTQQIAELSRDHSRGVVDRLREAVALTSEFYTSHPEVRDFVAKHAAEAPERSALLVAQLVRPAYEAIKPMLREGLDKGLVL